MIDWKKEIYDNWRRACGKSSLFVSQNYHDCLPAGQHTLRDGRGCFNFVSSQELFCLRYDELVSSELHGSRTLSNHNATRRCDYVLFAKERIKPLCLLVDITSSTAPTSQILEAEVDKKTGLTKSEKIPQQILHSLRALKLCSSINDYIFDCPELSHRIAVCAYTLGANIPSRDAFNRPIQKGQSRGATIYPHKELNQEGFSYHKVKDPNLLTIPV